MRSRRPPPAHLVSYSEVSPRAVGTSWPGLDRIAKQETLPYHLLPPPQLDLHVIPLRILLFCRSTAWSKAVTILLHSKSHRLSLPGSRYVVGDTLG